jgi:hypothetical protein
MKTKLKGTQLLPLIPFVKERVKEKEAGWEKWTAFKFVTIWLFTI